MDMRSERKALDKLYKRRDRYEIPDWQREEVWSDEKKRKLIDTILRGWKLPKFYFQKTSENPVEFDVVDGQQRLMAIWEFIGGELALSAETSAEFGGPHYNDLYDTVSDKFDDYEIEYDEITNATDEEVKDFFQRLQEGLPLTSSEKLNSVHSKLRDYCAKTSKDPFFSKTTVIADKRYAYFDILAKVAVLEIEGLDAGLRYEEIRKVFDSNASYSSQSASAKRIKDALKLLFDNFPQPFKGFRNRTIVQSIITLVCHLQEVEIKASQFNSIKIFIEKFLSELSVQVELGQSATDTDYLDFQRTVNANVKSGARTRQTILLRKLFEQYPAFFTDLKHSAAHADGVKDTISRRGTNIGKLIESINDQYAASHGKDLFKPTNKTASAITSFGNPIISLSEYKTLIDNLYFVFREGAGQRLDAMVPASFEDINDLRTMLRHDVDHGKGAKAAKKRQHLASVFDKYAGAASPEVLGPNAFPVVQANILAAVESDLRSLSRSLIQEKEI